MQHLGIQDATRKKRPPSLDAQAWAGCIIKMDGENVEKMVSQEKWDKSKLHLEELKRQARMEETLGLINQKILQQIQGFYNHLEMIIDFLLPVLKGLHNTIDGWRDG